MMTCSRVCRIGHTSGACRIIGSISTTSRMVGRTVSGILVMVIIWRLKAVRDFGMAVELLLFLAVAAERSAAGLVFGHADGGESTGVVMDWGVMVLLVDGDGGVDDVGLDSL